MAIDFLSIPAMSSNYERAFDQRKLTVTSERNSTKGATLELLLCLKDWLRNGSPAAEVATALRAVGRDV